MNIFINTINQSLYSVVSDPYARETWSKLIYEYTGNHEMNEEKKNKKIENGLWMLAFGNLTSYIQKQYKLDTKWNKCYLCGGRITLVNNPKKYNYKCKDCYLKL